MKTFVNLLVVVSLALSSAVFAHSTGHGNLNAKQAEQLAKTMAQMLTFKEQGMSVGKLDPSWSALTVDSFESIHENEDSYIVKAINEQVKQAYYFTVSKAGEVVKVEAAKHFETEHGHQH